jgi:hypothetical protein
MAFRPEIWATEFAKFFAMHPALIDRVARYDDLAAGAGKGETIKIPALTLSAIGDLVAGTDEAEATVTDGTVTLTIDKFRGHNIQVTPQDQRFNHPLWRQALLEEQARLQKNDTDSIILDIADDAAVTTDVNAGGGTWTDTLVQEAERALDDAEFPEEDRFLACTPEAYSDLASITEYISKDFGEGQGQRKVAFCRSFQLVKLPTARFNTAATVESCMAWHKSAIGVAVAAPHIRLVPRGGKFDDVLEMGAIWGLKIRKASGVVTFFR